MDVDADMSVRLFCKNLVLARFLVRLVAQNRRHQSLPNVKQMGSCVRSRSSRQAIQKDYPAIYATTSSNVCDGWSYIAWWEITLSLVTRQEDIVLHPVISWTRDSRETDIHVLYSIYNCDWKLNALSKK